jgi:hypothetical protein
VEVIEIVTVWGEQIELKVVQKSRSVWTASGEYLGQFYSAQDRSSGMAAARWREWATRIGG